MLCAVTALLLLHTGTICSNANLQQAYQLVQQGWARLLGSAVPPPAAALQACSCLQPLAVLLAYAVIGHHLYTSELAQRRAFLTRALHGVPRQGSSNSVLQQAQPRQEDQQPPQGQAAGCGIDGGAAERDPAAVHLLLLHQSFANTAADYWLSFALPGICSLRSIVLMAASGL